MNFSNYQVKARDFAVYGDENSVVYPVTLLNEEAGEVAGKLAKAMRKGVSYEDPQFKMDMAKELGDVLWAVANVASDLGLDLDEIAQYNLIKLEGRRERGTIIGSGDNR